jgi:hypothetical protein
MPRTKKGRGGRSRDPLVTESGKRGMIREVIQCDAKLNPKRKFIKRHRRDGSIYTVPIESGERCPEEAIASKHDGTKTVHRCAKHIGGY